MTTSITIKMTPQDFDLLSDMQMEWNVGNWMEQVKNGRFEDTHIALLAEAMDWAYWFDNPISCILAKSYLASNKHKFYTSYDLGSESWVIFTNYSIRVAA